MYSLVIVFLQKEELEKFEMEFLDKVKAVENSYRDRMDGLMMENTMLRRRWLEKTGELCKYQSDIERSQAQKIKKFKDTVSVRLTAPMIIFMTFACMDEDKEIILLFAIMHAFIIVELYYYN